MIYRRKRVRPPRHNHNGHGKGGNKGRQNSAAPGKPGGHNRPRGKGHGKKDFHVRVNPDSPFASLAGMFDKK